MKKLFILLFLLVPTAIYGSVDLTGPVAPKNDAFVCMVDDDMVCDQGITAGNLLVSDGVSFSSTDPAGLCVSITGSADLCRWF